MDIVGGRDEFRNVALEVIAKIFKDCPVFDMVSVQPMLGPCSPIFYTLFKLTQNPQQEKVADTTSLQQVASCEPDYVPGTSEIKLVLDHHEITAKTKNLKVQLKDSSYKRAGFTDWIAEDISNQICREVMTDLRNNAGTIATLQPPEDGLDYEKIYIKIVELSGIIHRKTLRGGVRWIATGPDIAEIMARGLHAKLPEFKKVQKVGVLNCAWKLIVDPLFPKNEILLGGYEELLQGYVYAPYVMLTETPIILDPETFEPKRGWMSRYGKYLFRSGAKAYARLKIADEPKQPALNYQI